MSTNPLSQYTLIASEQGKTGANPRYRERYRCPGQGYLDVQRDAAMSHAITLWARFSRWRNTWQVKLDR